MDERYAPVALGVVIADHLTLSAVGLARSAGSRMGGFQDSLLELTALSALPEPGIIEDLAEFCRRYTL